MRSILEHFVAPFDRSTTPRDLRRTRSFNEPLLPRPIPNPRCPSFGGKINPSTSNKITESGLHRFPRTGTSIFFSFRRAWNVSERREMANRSGSEETEASAFSPLDGWRNGEGKLEKRVSFTTPNPKVLLDVRENDSSPPR